MGCALSKKDEKLGGRAPRASVGHQDLAEYVAAAYRRLAHEESVIPCELTGALHSNCTGPSRGFCSAEARRQYHALHLQRIAEVGGNVLKCWSRLDADFALQHFSVSGSSPPPYRRLQPKVRQAMERSQAHYRKAFLQLPKEDRTLAASFEGLWPAASPEELKDCCLQPDGASSLRLTYAAGVQRLELLHQFSCCLARHVGSKRKVEWSVKRPFRMWRKTIESHPEEFADQDFRHVSDVYRTSIVVETMDEIRSLLDILEGLGRDAYDRGAVLQSLGLGNVRGYIVVERIKNRFVHPCPGGYMDVIANVRIDGYVMEVQMHLKELLDLKGDEGRHMYKWFRAFLRQYSEYTGERAEDGRMHGSGTFRPAMGGQYDGEFQNGLRHGEGSFCYANGDRYDGQFFEGKKHGAGTYSYASGDRYKGEFENDRMQGAGAYHFVNGDRFEGEYSEGKRHGPGTFFYEKGTCLTGEWWRNKHVSVVGV
mmetsp:Transcript_25473/g.73085  ORF Transcript_25473/g.73085 Transcript_25473/m.73085 type:complete len:481 (-) Transcript_25473:26-1468(-)